MNENILEVTQKQQQKFNRTLAAMVIPIAFQNFMTAMVSASDAVMLGFLEQEALAAVSLAGQITFILNLCITVLVQGTTILAAQYWGKGERNTVEMILALAVKYVIIVVTIFLICTFVFPEQIMGMLTNEPALIERGAEYLQIVGFSYVPLGLSQMYLGIMKNSQKYADWFFFNDIEYHIQCDFYIWNIRNSGYGNSGCCHSNCISCVYSAGMDIK